jgi:ethanolamine utilization cobalamin adenosyltransferase
VYRLENGAVLKEKPEHMTHLRGDILVEKTHPRIAFRGAMDTLEAELLLCQLTCRNRQKELGEILQLARTLIRCDVMEEPVPEGKLCGLTHQQIREHSHRPQDFYGQPHFMPEAGDGEQVLALNLCRCRARAAELAGAKAFMTPEGNALREDILRALNRMSSMLYILMIQEKGRK